MRLVGTGKAPEGQYPEGHVFDSAANSPEAKQLLADGWATTLDPADDPGRTVTQIANAVVRDDPLSNADDRAVAEREGLLDESGGPSERAYAVVHQQDPDAEPSDIGPAEGKPGVHASLKPESSSSAQTEDRRQVEPGPGSRATGEADGLDSKTIAELDELADDDGVEDYPRSGTKAEKVAALRANAGAGSSK